MNIRATSFGVAKLIQVLALFLFLPLGIALWDYKHLDFWERGIQADAFGFIIAIIISAIVGNVGAALFRADREKQTVKEGFAIVTFGWITLAFFGSIPLLCWG